MNILDAVVTVVELRQIAAAVFGDMVKAVVDVDRELIAIDAELHSDLEALLLENGSKQNSLWGINFYPDIDDDDFVEFDSMVNIRPSQGNKSRGVDSPEVQKKIISVVDKWVKR
ncbi:MAG: hypothetical protein KAR32_12780 [Candidatus Omnitrophica bacterium]|nr:hypothetical protein [Candidatus Omnitrophota bacterium]